LKIITIKEEYTKKERPSIFTQRPSSLDFYSILKENIHQWNATPWKTESPPSSSPPPKTEMSTLEGNTHWPKGPLNFF
jgi:hypothetical protein